MKIELDGKSAVVTGSTHGIGYAIAEGLAKSGAIVTITGRSKKSVDEASRALERGAPGKVRGVVVDLTTAEGCATLASQVPDADILVNNLGIYATQPFFEIQDEEWERFFQANVMSGVRLSRHYLRGMLDRDWGRVLFLSSESGLNIPPDMLHYGFTKTAVIGIARGLAKICADTGVTVNSLLPGPTMSAGLHHMLEEPARKAGVSITEQGRTFVKENRPSSIIGRVALPGEVANLAVYLCSPLASATTGAAMRVDGGVVDSL